MPNHGPWISPFLFDHFMLHVEERTKKKTTARKDFEENNRYFLGVACFFAVIACYIPNFWGVLAYYEYHLACIHKFSILPSLIYRTNNVWLGVWNMTFIFLYIGNFIIPIDELIFFQRGRYTTKQNVVTFHSDIDDIQPSMISPWFSNNFPG